MGGNGEPRGAEHQPALDVLSVLSGKWNPVVVLTLLENGALGFNELLDSIPDVSGKMLSKSLDLLEDKRMVERRVTSETPLRVEYDLTPAGRELDDAFAALTEWGRAHLEPARPTVLVAGSDRRITQMYGQWLSDFYAVDRTHDAEEIASKLHESVDVALVSDDLPGTTLASLLETVRSRCRTVLLVGDRPEPDIIDVPCDAVLRTPVVRATLLEAVDEQLSRRGESDEEREHGAMIAKQSVLEGYSIEAEVAPGGERSERESAADGSQ